MSLNQLSNQELIKSTEQALQREREAEVEVLRHFQEIEARGLWKDSGSLYKFISLTFGLTSDQIYPRLQAMRLMRAIPEVEQKLELGELSVTNALKAQQVFNSQSRQREVTLEEKREVLICLEHASTKEAQKVLAHKYPESNLPPEKIKPVARNQNLIQFYVDDETLNEIEELKAKFSHQMPSGKMEDLLKILIQKAKHEPKPRKLKSQDSKLQKFTSQEKSSHNKESHEMNSEKSKFKEANLQ